MLQDPMIQVEHLAALDMADGDMGQVSNEPCAHPMVVTNFGMFTCARCACVLSLSEVLTVVQRRMQWQS